jgi:hypothetical protein
MVTQRPDFDRSVEGGEDEEGGFDFEQLMDFGGFVLRAARRRLKLALAVFVVFSALGITLGKAMPSTYNSQVKLLAQRSTLLRTLSGVNNEINLTDNPTKNVADMIMRRDNVVALVKEADLVDRFEATRAPLLRFRDAIMTTVGGPPSEEDKLHALVATLESKLTVTADETNLTISVDWTDPRTAYDLVTLVQKNFLEARYDSDVAVVTDSIGVLQEHAKTELAKVDAALEEYERLLSERASLAAPSRPGPTRWLGVPSAGHAPTAVDAELMQALEEKRERVRSLEEERQHELDAIKQQLGQAQLTLTPMHPTVVALQHQADALSLPPPELSELKAEERALIARMAPAPAASASVRPPAGGGPAFATATAPPAVSDTPPRAAVRDWTRGRAYPACALEARCGHARLSGSHDPHRWRQHRARHHAHGLQIQVYGRYPRRNRRKAKEGHWADGRGSGGARRRAVCLARGDPF